MESKGLIVNMNKTKIMISGESCKGVYTGRWRCGVCGKGAGRNSIQCTRQLSAVDAQKVKWCKW